MTPQTQLLIDLIYKSCNEKQSSWLTQAVENISHSNDLVNTVSIFSAMARRKVGQQALVISDYVENKLLEDTNISGWTTCDTARIVFVLLVLEKSTSSPEDLIGSVYALGDEQEKSAILKGFQLIDNTGLAVDIAIKATRTNSLLLFEAISSHNIYPSHRFCEAAFNQVVVKSLHLGLDLGFILGLESRLNQELARICQDYYYERVNANREVPASIWLAIAQFANEEAQQLLSLQLQSEKPQHRFYATLAISRLKSIPMNYQTIIKQRMLVEDNPQIIDLLQLIG